MSGQFQILQHTKWSQWRPVVFPPLDGPCQHLPRSDTGDKYHRRHLLKGIGGVLDGIFGRSQPTPQRHGYLLPRFSALSGGGPPATWPERFHIPYGKEGAALVHSGMLPGHGL